jgi:hypothetical protein
MSEARPPFRLSHDYEVVVPANEEAYPVPKSDWEYLKERINRIEAAGQIYHTIGSILLGVAGSALLGALTLSKEMAIIGSTTILVCWGIFAVTLISGLLALFFAYQQRNLISCTKNDVITDMKRLEQRYGRK